MIRYPTALIWIAILAGTAAADLDTMPAARRHVRYVDGAYWRYTSKLSKVVDLNFTFLFSHSEGKPVISMMLSRIAKDYGTGGKDAFAIQRFLGPGNGTSDGLPQPMFTLADLMSAEVLVLNNVSNFNELRSINGAAASAFETAIHSGKSALGFHGTTEGDLGWGFYTQELLPLKYRAHGQRAPVPVYRNETERNHLVLERVLADSTSPMEVPMGVDSAGWDILRPGVPIRMILNENSVYAANLLTDPKYAPLTTCLLRYDPRNLNFSYGGTGTQYRYAGGHNFAFILKVGAGKSAYIPSGHSPDELTAGPASFDGGVGDFERFYAQMLFFLAGYAKEPCGGPMDCTGLPLVDSADHLVSRPDRIASVYGRPEFFDAERIGFAYAGSAPYRALLTDVRGKAVASRSGSGNSRIEFDPQRLRPGVYCLSVRIGSQSPRVHRYAIPLSQGRMTR